MLTPWEIGSPWSCPWWSWWGWIPHHRCWGPWSQLQYLVSKVGLVLDIIFTISERSCSVLYWLKIGKKSLFFENILLFLTNHYKTIIGFYNYLLSLMAPWPQVFCWRSHLVSQLHLQSFWLMDSISRLFPGQFWLPCWLALTFQDHLLVNRIFAIQAVICRSIYS